MKLIEDSGKEIELVSAWDAIIKEIRALLLQKNHAYGDTWQKFGSVGAFISLSKRFYRIKHLFTSETEPENTESIEDSLKDLINEASFLLILIREEKKK